MSLTLSSIPGFTELPDSDFNAGATASDTNMKALNADAKFATVRNEQFYGYYRVGETVQLPVSPADGYAYARSECLYSWSVYWTGSATTTLNGTQVNPAKGATSGGGTMLQCGWTVDPNTGAITGGTSYFNGTQNDTQDGILFVITHAQRQR
jgi:hypothetical protein